MSSALFVQRNGAAYWLCSAASRAARNRLSTQAGDGAPLPAALDGPFWPAEWLVAAGRLTLTSDTVLSEFLLIQCQSPLPAGTTCSTDPNGQTRELRYSAAEGWVAPLDCEKPMETQCGYFAHFYGDSIKIFYGSYPGISRHTYRRTS